jgi:hypothetical protein
MFQSNLLLPYSGSKATNDCLQWHDSLHKTLLTRQSIVSARMQVVIRPTVEKCEQKNNTKKIILLTGGDDTSIHLECSQLTWKNIALLYNVLK